MSLREIVKWPDPRLRVACDPVNDITPEIERLADDMLETMYAASGRGLAAPQVGVLRRLFVLDIQWKEAARDPMVFVNPQIAGTSDRMVTQPEVCLSIPGVAAEVSRPDRIDLRWTDLGGQPQAQSFEGIAAVCIQHEIDHLEGIVTLDHLPQNTRARVLRDESEAQA
ncbi:peptide deformylase [Roseobacter weihaiensis]|uniref:peptide deformylase n=1 Tax=Roseobacter weihaiensis TaxID=2763262 RepID=UPI001D0B3CDC|nr:peptide deformylase [Roseobacter sp. H9]